MARLGSRKTKSGCITCKIRRIKCDEAKPACVRCSSTGRKCDGYRQATSTAPRPRSSSPLPVERTDDSRAASIRPLTPSPAVEPRSIISQGEHRALDFFHHAVAPAITGGILPAADQSFWTHIVLQLGTKEPAVRHAASAIATLYEAFSTDPESRPEGRDDGFALVQYNASIKALVRFTTASNDQDVVLVVCVLLICAEFLQGNVSAAIEHCRHGIQMLNSMSLETSSSAWIKDNLLRVFWRLSVFPFFFGATPTTFPRLEVEAASVLHTASVPKDDKDSLDVLQTRLDVLITKAIRFVRAADEFRLDPSKPVPRPIISHQRELRLALTEWRTRFETLLHANTVAPSSSALAMLEMKSLVAVIWVDVALEYSETAYDAHLEKFKTIVDRATLALPDIIANPRPKFTFEMGFLPLLYFVAIKCRSLQTRVAALRLMRGMSAGRENLWDTHVMAAVARQVIELEHGVVLEDGEFSCQLTAQPGQKRVMDLVMDPEEISEKFNEQEAHSRRVFFLMPGSSGNVSILREKVVIPKVRNHDTAAIT
jgi:hypothetical protein